ncbi:MAG: hypothetical protein VW802_15500 [Rhodospirillaceae bacterium]|jgi:hypothetical protein
MHDKFLGMLVIGGVALPACMVCVVGVTAAGSMLTGAIAWLGGFDGIVSTALAITMGVLIFKVVRQHKNKDASAPIEHGKQEG